MDDVYNALTQEEDSRVAYRSYTEPTGGVSFAVQSQPHRVAPENRDKNATCSSCDRVGHVAENCFRQIGYPPWWGDCPRNRGPVNREGGASQTTSSKGKGVAMANVMESIHLETAGTSSLAISHGDRVGFSGLDDTQ